MEATIKNEFLNKRVGFGKSAAPLHKRSTNEINELALIAQQSNDPTLLRLFEILPSLAELKKKKTEAALGRVAGNKN